jgi:hypothetical protein
VNAIVWTSVTVTVTAWQLYVEVLCHTDWTMLPDTMTVSVDTSVVLAVVCSEDNGLVMKKEELIVEDSEDCGVMKTDGAMEEETSVVEVAEL